MSIWHNLSFTKLFHNILEILQYGYWKQVTKIIYQSLVRVVNQNLYMTQYKYKMMLMSTI